MIKMFFRFYKPFTLKTGQFKSSVSTYTQKTNPISISDLHYFKEPGFSLQSLGWGEWNRKNDFAFIGTDPKVPAAPSRSKMKPN